MQTNQKGYVVLQDHNSTKCNITFRQLMNVSPKPRAQVARGIKLGRN